MSISSCETVELGAYGLVKDCRLPKEMLKSLTERLCWPLQLSGMDSIIKQKVPKFLASERADKRSCVHRTCQVSLECSHLVDWEGY